MDKFKLEIIGNRGEFLTLIIKGKGEMEKLVELFLNNGKKLSIFKLEKGRTDTVNQETNLVKEEIKNDKQ